MERKIADVNHGMESKELCRIKSAFVVRLLIEKRSDDQLKNVRKSFHQEDGIMSQTLFVIVVLLQMSRSGSFAIFCSAAENFPTQKKFRT